MASTATALVVAALWCAGASVGVARAQGGAAACCEPDAMLRDPGQPAQPHCWRPADNTSRAVPLACANLQLFEIAYQLQSDGTLTLFDGDLRLADLDAGSFCLGGDLASGETPEPRNASSVVVTCFAEPEQSYFDEAVLGGCIIVSVVFFSLTAIVYATLTELRDLQGKSIINFCICFSIGLGILAGMRLAEYSDMNLCAARGFLAYFFIICGFFWMNALSIQFLLSIRRPSVLSYSWREFRWYAMYAWGLSAALTACMAAVNFAEGRHPKPGIGLNHCWFITPVQQWIYLYSVMSLLCAANAAIFLYTSTLLWRTRLNSTQTRALKYKFSMTLRLFILMGLPWVFEMAKSVSPAHIIWELLDLFNALQGLLVFLLLVVGRRRVLRALHTRRLLPAPCAARLTSRDDEEDDVCHTEVMLQ